MTEAEQNSSELFSKGDLVRLQDNSQALYAAQSGNEHIVWRIVDSGGTKWIGRLVSVRDVCSESGDA